MDGARASGRGDMMNGGRSFSGRLIPKRGQVKIGIVLGLANSVAGIFSRTISCAAPPHPHPHPHLTH